MSLPSQTHGMYERHVFDVAGIPVFVSAWYLVMVWLVLLTAGSMEAGLIWLAVVTVAVLMHELGHGLVARHYGLGPRIMLHAFGGWCSHAQAPTARSDAQVVAAGPAVNFALAGVGWFAWLALPDTLPWSVLSFAYATASFNLFLGVLNLLPVYPLDGGRLTLLGLQARLNLDRGEELAQQISVGVGGFVALVSLFSGYVFFGILFGMLAYQAYERLTGTSWIPEQMVARGGPVSSGSSSSSAPALAFPWRPTATVQVLMIGYVAVYVLARLMSGPAIYQLLALTPAAVSQGHLWQVATWAVVMDPERWQDLMLVVGGLYLFGPLLELDLGQRAFTILYGIAALVIGLVAVLLGVGLPSVFGGTWVAASGLVYMLLFAWAALQRDSVIDSILGVPLQYPWLAGAVLAMDTLSFLSGGDTAWHLHVAGALIGWFAIDRRQSIPLLARPERVTQARPQLRVVSNRDDDWVH